MVIYGVAALAFCYLGGQLTGEILGHLIGLGANVGGVGFAMFFLLLLLNYVPPFNDPKSKEADGIRFWQAMFLPVVVAMSASQNMLSAISGGWLAITAGVGVSVVSILFVPLLKRIGGDSPLEDSAGKEAKK